MTIQLSRGQLQRKKAQAKRALMTKRDQARDQRDKAAQRVRELTDQIKAL